MYWAIFFFLLFLIILFSVLVAKKKLSPTAVNLINLVLMAAAVYLGYLIYDSITAPVRFNKTKKERYAKVISRLKDIRDSEIAYRTINGQYTANFDSLVRFIDTAKFTITQRRDSVIKEFNKFRGITEEKEIVIIDTLGFVPVKDSLFKGDNRYKEMQWVPIPGREKQVKFELKAGKLKKGEVYVPVFMARVHKKEILYDQPEDLVKEELAIKSTEEVNGPYIQVGSMDDVTTAGNWPKIYDIKDKRE